MQTSRWDEVSAARSSLCVGINIIHLPSVYYVWYFITYFNTVFYSPTSTTNVLISSHSVLNEIILLDKDCLWNNLEINHDTSKKTAPIEPVSFSLPIRSTMILFYSKSRIFKPFSRTFAFEHSYVDKIWGARHCSVSITATIVTMTFILHHSFW